MVKSVLLGTPVDLEPLWKAMNGFAAASAPSRSHLDRRADDVEEDDVDDVDDVVAVAGGTSCMSESSVLGGTGGGTAGGGGEVSSLCAGS